MYHLDHNRAGASEFANAPRPFRVLPDRLPYAAEVNILVCAPVELTVLVEVEDDLLHHNYLIAVKLLLDFLAIDDKGARELNHGAGLSSPVSFLVLEFHTLDSIGGEVVDRGL